MWYGGAKTKGHFNNFESIFDIGVLIPMVYLPLIRFCLLFKWFGLTYRFWYDYAWLRLAFIYYTILYYLLLQFFLFPHICAHSNWKVALRLFMLCKLSICETIIIFIINIELNCTQATFTLCHLSGLTPSVLQKHINNTHKKKKKNRKILRISELSITYTRHQIGTTNEMSKVQNRRAKKKKKTEKTKQPYHWLFIIIILIY